jgi:hypothetical protein
VKIASVSDGWTWPTGVNVADELVFAVSGAEANSVRATTLLEVGFSERHHLQEWVLAHPEILGPDIAVVTFEFDRWWAVGGDPRDRLDVLGLYRSGRLVVAELKRTQRQTRWRCKPSSTRRWRAASRPRLGVSARTVSQVPRPPGHRR